MRTLRIVNLRADSAPGSQTRSADFLIGRRRHTVWLRCGDDGPLAETADPFLPAGLIPAMRCNWAMAIDGVVSPRLLDGSRRIQETIAGWYPDYRRVPVSVCAAPAAAARGKRPVAMFFSGGVDSFYTLQQHRQEISHLIFVHGFDVPLKRRQERRRISESIGDLAARLQLQVVEVETNLRQFGQPRVGWLSAYCGAALAAVALLLAPRFERIYIAATVAATQLEPMGSHPALDPYWSNEAVELVHDGLHATRFEKIRAIADWPPVRRGIFGSATRSRRRRRTAAAAGNAFGR